jgi:hypothetical protein
MHRHVSLKSNRLGIAGALCVAALIAAWVTLNLGRFDSAASPQPIPRLIEPARAPGPGFAGAPSTIDALPKHGEGVFLIPYPVAHSQSPPHQL